MTSDTQPLDTMINSLCDQGYAICEDFLPADIVRSLASEAMLRHSSSKMIAAKIGKTNKILNQAIRGDAIAWLDENDPNTNVQAYFSYMYALRQAINTALFMNLFTLETHFAIYPVGGAYKRHLDQFNQGENTFIQTRQLSTVLYLNEHWQADDGGELRLYLSEETWLDISPNSGKLVLFLSDRFWHEVLPAKRDRISLTGWFRLRSDLNI